LDGQDDGEDEGGGGIKHEKGIVSGSWYRDPVAVIFDGFI